MANWISSLTDAIGLTDSDAPNRAVRTASEGLDKSNKQLDADTSNIRKLYSDAMDGRTIAQNLDKYDAQNDAASAANWGTLDAGDFDNVQNYINPMKDMMLDETMDRVNSSAGSALQSSATTKKASDAIASQTAQLYQQGFNNAMTDAQGNRAVAGNASSLAGNRLTANNSPTDSWASMESDLAMNKYNGANNITGVAATAAGQRNTIL